MVSSVPLPALTRGPPNDHVVYCRHWPNVIVLADPLFQSDLNWNPVVSSPFPTYPLKLTMALTLHVIRAALKAQLDNFECSVYPCLIDDCFDTMWDMNKI
jgi:hypothetical protein